MKYIYFAIMCVMAAGELWAQSGNITGQIYDEQKLPLSGVVVSIGEVGLSVVTDHAGEFNLRVPSGTHTLSTRYLGFEDLQREVTVEDGRTIRVSLALAEAKNELDEVIVTGSQTRGQAKALNTQRTNGNITNVVSADQVGRFPDANIGESMRRIPGITMQNDQGEARDIVIRGMAPQLNSVMINGERVPSAEGDNRQIQMDLIPADMVQTIEVNKAVTPDMDADAIGGAVNLVTRTAPSGQRISITGASGLHTFNNSPIWTGAFVYGNRFANDKLGVVVSGSVNDVNYGSDNVEFEWDYDGSENEAYISDQQIRQYHVRRVRRSFSTNLDYRLSDGHTIFVRGIYNWRDDWENRYRFRLKDIEAPDANGMSVARAQRQTKGGINNNRNHSRRLEDQRMWSIQLGGQHLLGNLEANWTVTRSQASEERPNERYVTYAYDDGINKTVPVHVNMVNPKFPLVSVTDPTMTMGSNMVLDELSGEYQFTSETDMSARLDFNLPLASGKYKSELKFGGRYRDKLKIRDNDFYEYTPTSGFMDNLTQTSSTDETKDGFLAGDQYDAGSFASGEYLGDLALEDESQFDSELKYDEFASVNYEANEQISSAYAMVNQQLGSKLLMIAGVRWENTITDYSGNRFNEDTEEITPIAETQSYNNFLPGIHLKYSAMPNFILRGAWTNTLARPNYYDLVPYELISPDDNEIELGNPELTPATAMNLDIMAEYYYQSLGILSGGGFYKQIDNFVYTASQRDVEYNGNTWDVLTQPLNGATAQVYGAEVAWQRKFDFIPGRFWNSMSIYTNYTFTQTNTDGIQGREDGLSLAGSANHMVNASLAYDDEKLTVRVSANYSDDYIDEYGSEDFFDRYYDQQLFLDVNASYAFTPYLRVFAEATNLTNQPLRYFQGIQERTMQMEYYNTRFNLGLKLDL